MRVISFNDFSLLPPFIPRSTPTAQSRPISIFANNIYLHQRWQPISPSGPHSHYDSRVPIEIPLLRNPLNRVPDTCTLGLKTLPITSTMVVLLAECPCLLLATHVYDPESTPFCTDITVSIPSCKSVFCLKSSGNSLPSTPGPRKRPCYYNRVHVAVAMSIRTLFPPDLVDGISGHRAFYSHVLSGHRCDLIHWPHVRVTWSEISNGIK